VKDKSVEVKISGKNFLGKCPFHHEETPSFTVDTSGKFYCFGCKESGCVSEIYFSEYGN
jgi:DNA primase